MDVPFKVLDKIYDFGITIDEYGKPLQENVRLTNDEIRLNDNEIVNQKIVNRKSGNMIIHGDNLEALKALLPEYEGRIKCIYIDPPYNTGNEGWVYNDNVNDPKIKKWLGQVVGKESEDLSRHDKWLCMMYPRLKLLHKLLSNDGAIFISIDDNEAFYLKIICDEMFGTNGFKANLIWKSRQIVDSRNQTMISKDHEYVLVYGKSTSFKLRGKFSDKSKYSNPDNDIRGPWMSNSILGLANIEQRPNLHYKIVDPETQIEYDCPPSTGWRYSRETMSQKIEEKRIFFPKKKDGRPREKKFLNELSSDFTGFSTILSEEVGFTLNGTRTVREIVPDAKFAFPKPLELVQTLIEQATGKNSVILDSFAGSGTTAHAVLNLNKQDGGNRKFICIEMEDYAEAITAERAKRVIKGYGSAGSPQAEGTGGSFDFYELGQPMFLEDGNLNELVGLEKIRQYIYYTETKTPLPLTNDDLRNDLRFTNDNLRFTNDDLRFTNDDLRFTNDDLRFTNDDLRFTNDDLRFTNDDLRFTNDDLRLENSVEPNPQSKVVNPKSKIVNPKSYLGKHNDTAYYFHYEQDEVTTLNHAFLATMKTKAEQYVIYADNCLLTKDFMTKHNIIFKKIPRDITRF